MGSTGGQGIAVSPGLCGAGCGGNCGGGAGPFDDNQKGGCNGNCRNP
jgi:hypothetical protein